MRKLSERKLNKGYFINTKYFLHRANGQIDDYWNWHLITLDLFTEETIKAEVQLIKQPL